MWLGFAFGLKKTAVSATSFLGARAMKFMALNGLLQFMSDLLIGRTFKI